jgi:hypothetical protein
MAKCNDKKCPSGRICNPKSGRCVKKDGVIGKKILAEKKKKSSKPVVRCSRIRKYDCKKKAGCHWVVGKGCKKGKKSKPSKKSAHLVEIDGQAVRSTRSSMSPRRSRSNTYRWMSYASAAKHIPEAKEKGVSKVARGRSGFMGVYKRVGSSKNMAKESYTETQTWGRRRNAFIKRHMAQYKKNPTRRRWLALAMWAYKPPGTAPK